MPAVCDPGVCVLETERLVLRRLEFCDAPFLVELLNEPGWLRFIGDKGVRSTPDAELYIRTGPHAMYARHGFGLYLVERKADRAPLGLCGLLKRDALECVDIGFAFRASATGMGYASESAAAVREQARALGLRRLMAIATPDNAASHRVLRKLGMRFDMEITMSGEAETLHLFVIDL